MSYLARREEYNRGLNISLHSLGRITHPSLSLPPVESRRYRVPRWIRFIVALAIGLKVVLAAGAVSGQVTLAVAVLFGDLGASLAVTLNALRLAATHPE